MVNKYFIFILISFISVSILRSQNQLVYPKQNQVLTSTEIELVWSEYLGAVDYSVQVASDFLFTDIIVNEQDVLTNQFLTPTLLENQKYYWRVMPSNGTWSTVGSFVILDISSLNNIVVWLDPNDVILNGTNKVETWIDQSGNYNFTESVVASMPYYINEHASFNNLPALDFSLNEQLKIGNVNLSFLQQAEVFAVLQVNNYPAISTIKSGLWEIGTNASSDHYPFTDGNIYNGTARNTRFNVGNHSSQVDFTNPHLVNISSSSAYTFRINGIQRFQTTSGSVGVSNSVKLGKSYVNHWYNGYIGDFIIFNEVLTDSMRIIVNNYIKDKYTAPLNLGVNFSLYGYCDTTLHAGDRFTSYLWSNGATGESITVNQSGTYWVQVTDIFGFTSSDTIVVTYPEVEQPTNLVFCPGGDIEWNANLGANYDYLWSTGETTESITINTEGNYFVTITDTNGCQRVSDTLFFEEDPFASTVSLGPDVNLCTGNTIALVSGAAETVSYLWGGGETTPSIVVNTTDTYTVEVENANGCVATDDILVTIVGDAPVVQIGMDPSYCQLETVDFTDNSYTTDASTIVSWDWDFGDLTGSIDESGTHVYNDHGQFTVQLTVTTDAGCVNTGDQVVEIFQKPIINFSTVNECQSDPINFYSNQSTLPFINNWTWNFDDPASGSANTATGEITSHVFEAFGDYDVELMAEDVNGCRDTVIQTVSILPAPQVAFAFNEVCVGQTVNFTNQSTIEDPYLIATTQWQLGGGATSNQFSPSRLYITAGNYTITLTVTANNGCVQQLTQPLKIHAQPNPDYTFSPSCAGLPTVFTDASVVPDGSVSFVTWQFNANNPVNGDVVSHSFTNPGTQQVRQIVVSDFGCQFTEISNIETNPELSADFSVGSNLILAGAPTIFQNESIGAETYEWEIGGFYSGTDESPELTFPLDNIGDTVSVVLVASNSFGCSDTLRVDLVIYEARTDLAITQVFTYTNPDGFITLGAELTNMGSSTITQADLYLRMSETSPSKGTWEGELGAGEKEIYLFPVSPYQSAESENINDQYICVEGRIVLPAGLIDEVPANNEFCRNMAEEEAIILIPYPNPVTNELSLRVIMPANQTVDIQIFDASGKLVYTVANNGELQKGLNTFTVNVSNWSEGSYTIYLKTQETRKTVRFVKS